MPRPRPPQPKITALSYLNGKPFISGVKLTKGTGYTISATVNNVTKSVVWKRDGNTVKTDSIGPFDYTWTPGILGAHRYEVIPYSSTGGSGTKGPSIIVDWTCVESAPPVLATALVSWTQVANAQGYRVFWGTVSKQYSYNHDVSTLNYRVPDLTKGTPYFFSAKSFNTSQVSDFGNEVRYVP